MTVSVSADTLTLDYQADQNGTATITVTATSNGQTVSDAFVVTVIGVGDAPVISQGAGPLNKNVLEDGTATWVSSELNATDVDVGDILTWSVSSAATNGTATGSGTGASPAA